MKISYFRRADVMAPSLAIAASLAVHTMALSSGFVDDDFLHLYGSVAYETRTWLFEPFGSHLVPLFRLVWLSLHALFGMNAVGYFATALLLHVINIALLYGVLEKFTGRTRLAGIAAGLWGSAPALQGTLSWLSAFGMILSATTALWALYELGVSAKSKMPPRPWCLVRANVAIIAGSGAVLVGSMTAVIFPLVAYLVLPAESAPLRTALRFVPAAALSVLAVTVFAGHGPPSLAPPGAMLTLFVELLVYGLGLVVAGPLVTLHRNGKGIGIFDGSHDGGAAVLGSAVFAVPLLALVAWRVMRGDRRERRLLIGAIAMSVVLYAGTAIGRAGFAIDSLARLATVDRYHYASNIGLVLAVSVALAGVGIPVMRSSRARAAAFLAVAFVYVLSCREVAERTTAHRHRWVGTVRAQLEEAILQIVDEAPRENVVCVRNDVFKPMWAVVALGADRSEFPGIGAYWALLHGDKPISGRTIRFVEEDAAVLARIRARTRPEVASLFMGKDEANRAHLTVHTIFSVLGPKWPASSG